MPVSVLLIVVVGICSFAGLTIVSLFGYGVWIAHKLTMQERMPVSEHPLQLGLHWEDVTFASRGDFVPLAGWYLPAAAEPPLHHPDSGYGPTP